VSSKWLSVAHAYTTVKRPTQQTTAIAIEVEEVYDEAGEEMEEGKM
jgi:hypothetical protein